ncbi:hypothetical protein AB1Y20_019200 [Prymnesium parvum]|uniref:Calcyclin-binding protein n=1 Tax=Prymnesium parvum TaxID=97485 RepID=A0AB34JTZ1_PRYPA
MAAENAQYTAGLKEDVAEIEALIADTARPKVRAILCDYLTQLQAEIRTRSIASAPAMNPSNPTPPQQTPRQTTAPNPAPTLGPVPVKLAARPPPPPLKSDYKPITSMAWDQDSYGKEPNNVYVYLTSGLDGIGEAKDRVSCEFSKSSFDLKIHDFGGRNYRLVKTNLDKDIIPHESKVVVKKNRITITLRKAKGAYGYDTWMDLVAKRPRGDEASKDPSAGIMDMMKQLYEDGDDNMKKMIGETMQKSRQEQMMPPDRQNFGLDDKLPKPDFGL